VSPELIIALVRLGIKLGIDLFALLREQGITFSNEELEVARNESQGQVDRWQKMLESLRAARPDGV